MQNYNESSISDQQAEKYLLKKVRWKGVDKSGNSKCGEILALSETEARQSLVNQGIKITRLKYKKASVFSRIKHKASTNDINLLTRQLSTMLNSGVPLLSALQLISGGQSKAEIKSLLFLIMLKVEEGISLSRAMREVSPHFKGFYSDLIAAGELSGHLPEALDRLAGYRENSAGLQAKIIKALIYPAIVFCVAIGVTYLMMTMVIPEFESMFNSFNAKLPWFTQQVLSASLWLQDHTLYLLLLTISIPVTFNRLYQRSYKFRLFSHKFILKLPLIGSLISKVTLAVFCRTLATSFHAGIPVLNALDSTAKTVINLHYKNAIKQIAKETAGGTPIHIAMKNTQRFPDMVVQMVMIGEESGNLDKMLNKIAAICETDVQDTIENLGKIIEPFIIIFLGTVIGGLVVSMYLPIFNLMNVLG